MARAAGLDAGRYRAVEDSRWVPGDVAEGVTKVLEDRGIAVPSWLTPPTPQREEVVYTIAWTRDDVLDAINRAAGTSLVRGGDDLAEVEEAIDLAVTGIGKQLRDRSVELGWEVIDTLLPDEAIERCAQLALAPEPTSRDETMRAFDAASEYRSHVTRALRAAGWDVSLNDAGDIVTLSHLSERTGTTFYASLDMRGRDPSDPGDWVRAAHDARDTPPLRATSGPDAGLGQSYADSRLFTDAWMRPLPHRVLGAVREVVPPSYNDDLVCDWYVRMYPTDPMGPSIDNELTFARALGAVSLGGGFYDVLGVGESDVREIVFQEIANRYGIDYGIIYESWLHKVPVPVAPSANEPLSEQGLGARGLRRARRGERERDASHGGAPREGATGEVDHEGR